MFVLFPMWEFLQMRATIISFPYFLPDCTPPRPPCPTFLFLSWLWIKGQSKFFVWCRTMWQRERSRGAILTCSTGQPQQTGPFFYIFKHIFPPNFHLFNIFLVHLSPFQTNFWSIFSPQVYVYLPCRPLNFWWLLINQFMPCRHAWSLNFGSVGQ